jgi:hypothetical protein
MPWVKDFIISQVNSKDLEEDGGVLFDAVFGPVIK